MTMKKQNIILLVLFALLIIIPLIVNKSGEFSGTDNNAEVAIQEISPTYEPWFTPLWAPPSSEVESLLFTLLAVVGASTLSFYVGYVKGKNHDKD